MTTYDKTIKVCDNNIETIRVVSFQNSPTIDLDIESINSFEDIYAILNREQARELGEMLIEASADRHVF